MDLKLSDVESKSTANYNIDRLRKWLDYELSGLAIWGSALLIVKWFFILMGATIAALVFIPLLIVTLLQEKRYGWLISFFVLIAIPPLVVYLTIANSTWTLVAAITSLGFFYFYCGILRFVIREW